MTSASTSLKSLGRNVEVGNRKRDEEVHAFKLSILDLDMFADCHVLHVNSSVQLSDSLCITVRYLQDFRTAFALILSDQQVPKSIQLQNLSSSDLNLLTAMLNSII